MQCYSSQGDAEGLVKKRLKARSVIARVPQASRSVGYIKLATVPGSYSDIGNATTHNSRANTAQGQSGSPAFVGSGLSVSCNGESLG